MSDVSALFSAVFKKCTKNRLKNTVVSTVISGILFARFPTVECISKGCSFLLWHHSFSKKFQSRRKVIINVITGLTIHFITNIFII